MKKDKKTDVTGISKANSLEEIGDFWGSHRLADHWDETHENVAVLPRLPFGPRSKHDGLFHMAHACHVLKITLK
jgi:hypothetical protein